MDERCKIRGRAFSGASNPVNVGIEASANAMISAAREVLGEFSLAAADVLQICAGVAGSGEPQVSSALEKRLNAEFRNAQINLVSDLKLSLLATKESPSIVVLAGTGSAVLGRDRKGNTARAGGLGPIIGDPGSAYEIGREAISAALQKHLSANEFALGELILASQQCSWSELADRARAKPTEVFPMVFRVVGAAGERGEREAQALLRAAAQDLARMVDEVIRQLKLGDQEFFLGKTGGVFIGSPYLAKEFEQQILAVAPKVRIGSLPQSLGESAARLACEALQTSAVQTKP